MGRDNRIGHNNGKMQNQKYEIFMVAQILAKTRVTTK